MQVNQVIPGQIIVDRDTETAEKTYYCNLDGACYYFQDGRAARFENGVYTTKFKGEQEELDKMCGTWDKIGKKFIKPPLQSNGMFFPYPVDVQRSDAKILKDINAVRAGIVNTQSLTRN